MQASAAALGNFGSCFGGRMKNWLGGCFWRVGLSCERMSTTKMKRI